MAKTINFYSYGTLQDQRGVLTVPEVHEAVYHKLVLCNHHMQYTWLEFTLSIQNSSLSILHLKQQPWYPASGNQSQCPASGTTASMSYLWPENSASRMAAFISCFWNSILDVPSHSQESGYKTTPSPATQSFHSSGLTLYCIRKYTNLSPPFLLQEIAYTHLEKPHLDKPAIYFWRRGMGN